MFFEFVLVRKGSLTFMLSCVSSCLSVLCCLFPVLNNDHVVLIYGCVVCLSCCNKTKWSSYLHLVILVSFVVFCCYCFELCLFCLFPFLSKKGPPKKADTAKTQWKKNAEKPDKKIFQLAQLCSHRVFLSFLGWS